MRVPCPHCGSRPFGEFVEMGAADPKRPNEDAGLVAYVDYVYRRDNPAGRHREIFLHTGGCRAVLMVERDTLTHQIYSVVDAAEIER